MTHREQVRLARVVVVLTLSTLLAWVAFLLAAFLTLHWSDDIVLALLLGEGACVATAFGITGSLLPGKGEPR